MEKTENNMKRHHRSNQRRKYVKRVLSSPKVHLEENDDNAEFLEEQESEEQAHRLLETTTRLSEDQMLEMSEDKVLEHYNVCMKLAVQNKINSKNAFSLKLIDLLKRVFLSQSQQEINFAAAGTALGASTMIYSYRIDNIYNQAVRLANVMNSHKMNSEKAYNSQSQSSNEKSPLQAAPAKRGAKIAKKEQLRRNMLCNKVLPIEKIQSTCLMSVFPLRRPSEGIILGKHQPLFPQSETNESANGTVLIRLKKYAPHNRPKKRTSTPIVVNIEKPIEGILEKNSCNMHPDPIRDKSLSPQHLEIDMVADYGSVDRLSRRRCEDLVLPVQLVEPELLPNEDQQLYCHYFDTRKNSSIKTPSIWPLPTGHRNKYDKCEAVSTLLPKKKITKNIKYHGNQSSIISFNKKCLKPCNTTKWKQSALLQFHEDLCKKDFRRLYWCRLIMKEYKPESATKSSVEDENIQSKHLDKPVTLSLQTNKRVMESSEDEIDETDHGNGDTDSFASLLATNVTESSKDEVDAYHGSKATDSCTSLSAANSNNHNIDMDLSEESSDHSNQFDGNNLVPTPPKRHNIDMDLSEESCDDSNQFVENNLVPTPPKRHNIDVDLSEESSDDSNLLVGNNLVPAPPKRVIPSIRYTLNPKRINMKKMKDIFWSKIENRNRNSQADSPGDSLSFKCLLDTVRSELPDEEAENLSWQLSFVTVLHLASENNLHLRQVDQSDFYIEKEEECSYMDFS